MSLVSYAGAYRDNTFKLVWYDNHLPRLCPYRAASGSSRYGIAASVKGWSRPLMGLLQNN